MFNAKTARTTLAWAAALAALVPLTAFADPRHDHDQNRDSDGHSYTQQWNGNANNDDQRANGYNQNYSQNGYGYNQNTNQNWNNYQNGQSYQPEQTNRQNNKNTWRNLGIAGAAVAALGLLNHNGTATLLGAAGAAYSANRYEQDRQSQSQQNNDYGHWRANRRRY